MDRTVEGPRPFVHRRIKVRMRDRDRLQATKTLDHTDRRCIERSNAIPQNIAAFRAHEQCALADGKAGADSDQTGVVFMEAIHVVLRQGLKRGPGLSAWRHVLALLLANGAFAGRLRTVRILGTACGADVEGHECPLAIVMVTRRLTFDAFSFCKAAMQAMRLRRAGGVATFKQFNVRGLCLVQSKIFVISISNATDSRGTQK